MRGERAGERGRSRGDQGFAASPPDPLHHAVSAVRHDQGGCRVPERHGCRQNSSPLYQGRAPNGFTGAWRSRMLRAPGSFSRTTALQHVKTEAIGRPAEPCEQMDAGCQGAYPRAPAITERISSSRPINSENIHGRAGRPVSVTFNQAARKYAQGVRLDIHAPAVPHSVIDRRLQGAETLRRGVQAPPGPVRAGAAEEGRRCVNAETTAVASSVPPRPWGAADRSRSRHPK